VKKKKNNNPLDVEVIVEDKKVTVQFTGFDSIEEANTYAEFLANNLSKLLYNYVNGY
jgi:hypothetical protein